MQDVGGRRSCVSEVLKSVVAVGNGFYEGPLPSLTKLSWGRSQWQMVARKRVRLPPVWGSLMFSRGEMADFLFGACLLEHAGFL